MNLAVLDRPHIEPSTRAARVLHVFPGNLFGGVERALLTMHQQRRWLDRVAMEFAACFPGRLTEELQAAGASVADLGPVRLSRPWTVWRARRRLARLLRQSGYDLVNVHSAWSHVVFAPTARAAGVPVLFWVHDRLDDGSWINRLARRIEPEAVLANSTYTLSSVGATFPVAPAQCVYLPVAPVAGVGAARGEVRHELGCPDDSVVILCASRMDPMKGHRVLLQALVRLRPQPHWQCWIAGGAQRGAETRYLYELQSQARDCGLGDRVRFLGERRDVPRLLAGSDVYCQANVKPETFGLSFIEALWSGVPVVTSALGGAVEILNGHDAGVLVPPSDPAALSAALQQLIDDPQRRRTMAEAAPRLAQSLCDPAGQMRAIEQLLLRVIAGGGGSQ